MPPQGQSTDTFVLNETDFNEEADLPNVPPSAGKRKLQIVWYMVAVMTFFYVGGVYGAYLFFTKAMWPTIFFAILLSLCSSIGVTAGAHRLWSHKSFKARLPLRILLTFFNTIAFQDSVVHWARDHRMHHKYSETDADPHNATRGIFFSHVGWLLVRKHPEIIAKGNTIDMSDLEADPILRFQKNYYLLLMALACFIMPTYIPTLWGETLWNAYFVCGIFRYAFVLNCTFLVNSAAHKWGNKPYDKDINPVEIKFLNLVVFGEAFHNYHHTFPWDYKTAELGDYSLNLTKLFIDIMAKFGWAYDLKTVSPDVIKRRTKRTGDGSHKEWGHEVNVEKIVQD